MVKTELIAEVATKAEITKVESEKVVNAVLDTIVGAVSANEKVQIVGFGSFEKRHRAARVGHDPRDKTKEINIPAKDVPVFKAGKNFKSEVAGK